jgi:hypothetical protein
MTIGPMMKKRQDNSERDGRFSNNIVELFEQSGKLKQSKKPRHWQL